MASPSTILIDTTHVKAPKPLGSTVKPKCKKKMLTVFWGEFIKTENSCPEEDSETTLELIKEVTKEAIIMEPGEEIIHGEPSFIELPRHLTFMDPVVLHTVQLNACVSKLETMVCEMLETQDSIDEPNTYAAVPLIPKMAQPMKRRCFKFPFLQLDRDETDFSSGIAKPDLRLSFANAKVFLKKSVATLISHVGYQEASESILDVVTDVVAELLSTVGSRLRVAVDQETMSSQAGFHDPVERVLTELNLGSLEDLLFYYQDSIIDYHDKVEQRCTDLSEQYSTLVKTKVSGLTETEQEEELVQEEEEEMMEEEEDEEDVPEIHFPALDEEDQLGLQPSLEPGFQMLDSLEHDETLQNLDPDEEINVSDSPSQEFMLSVISELSNTMESTKSKKRKSRKHM